MNVFIRSSPLKIYPSAYIRYYSSISLRDYQQDAIKQVKYAIERGVRRPAFVLATGGGKTMVFSHLIPDLPRITPSRGSKVLVLAHKEELVKQAAATIQRVNPDLTVEIDMRHLKPSFQADVIVGSVPTLVRMQRLQKYNPDDFKAIILDECHHATASSWTKILKYFNADSPQLEIVVVGCTATMERSDGAALGNVFDEIVYERDLLSMVENKELVDVKFSSLKLDIDLKALPTKFNDYETTSLSNLMNTEDTNIIVASSYKKLRKEYGFKATLMFCVDIDHCKTLCGVLQSHGINAQYVTGDTVKLERHGLVEDFKQGKIDVLCNVQVFTEGTDIPNIDSLFLVRPTKSRPLLVQMIGRGLRLHEGKTHCHVVDIAGTRGTGIQSVPTLFSLPSDYLIHGKTFRDLEKEKEEYLEEEQNKEVERKLEEQKLVERMKQVENKLALEFTTVEGFMALEASSMNDYRENRDVHKFLNKDILKWLRLEYDLWANPIDERFLLLQKFNSGEENFYKLYITKFTSLQHRLASNYQCGKIANKTELIASHNLETVLAKAASLRSELKPPFKVPDGPITKKQVDYIYKRFKVQVKKYYADTPELQQKLMDELSLLTKTQAGFIIFALKYSTSTLYNKWELQSMLGITKQAQKAVKKLMKLYKLGLDFTATSILE